jgi:hypothetical protein
VFAVTAPGATSSGHADWDFFQIDNSATTLTGEDVGGAHRELGSV